MLSVKHGAGRGASDLVDKETVYIFDKLFKRRKNMSRYSETIVAISKAKEMSKEDPEVNLTDETLRQIAISLAEITDILRKLKTN